MAETQNKIFLGIDGGQSSTKAIVADEFGNILGRGFGGALDHGSLPDSGKKLRDALSESVNEALGEAKLGSINETIKLAIGEQDKVINESGLHRMVVEHFAVTEIRELTNAFYNGKLARDEIAAFAETIFKAAEAGHERLKSLIESGVQTLVENVK